MPPRKKTRLQTTESDGNMNQSASTNTRARTKIVRGRRGGLKDMPNMPLDVLLEIFAFMHPRDLLNLARTTKSFRAFLLARSARPLWRIVMERVEDLPKCPSYMSEPAYVNLVFFPCCHNCLKSNVQTVIFEFSARYCNSCRQIMSLSREDNQRFLEEIVSVTGVFKSYFPVVYESHKPSSAQYHKSDVSRFRARWETLNIDDAKKKLAEQQVERVHLIHLAALEFQSWKDKQKLKRTEELDQMRAARFASILNHLREEGWTEELDLLTSQRRASFGREKFATKPEHLTERGWQKIRADVVSCMETIKAARLDDEMRAILQRRFTLFEKSYKIYRPGKRDQNCDLDPRLMDLAAMPEFRSMLEPQDADMTILEDEETMRMKFDAAIPKWRQDRKDELTSMIRQLPNVPQDLDPLDLATALFACGACGRETLRYPAVVAHFCAGAARGNDLYESTLDHYESKLSRSWMARGRHGPWTAKFLSPSTMAVSRLRPILEVCGLDPQRATHQEMIACASRLRRIGSSRVSGNVERESRDINGSFLTETISYEKYDVFCCGQALAYSLTRTVYPPEWARLPADEAAKITELEGEGLEQLSLIDWDRYLHGCAHCDYARRRRAMPDHLKFCHDIDMDDHDVDRHCYLHTDADYEPPQIQVRRYRDGTFEAEFKAHPSLDFLFNWGWDSDDEDSEIWDYAFN